MRAKKVNKWQHMNNTTSRSHFLCGSEKVSLFFPVLCFAHPPDALCTSAVKNRRSWPSAWPPDPLAKGTTVKASLLLPPYPPRTHSALSLAAVAFSAPPAGSTLVLPSAMEVMWVRHVSAREDEKGRHNMPVTTRRGAAMCPR